MGILVKIEMSGFISEALAKHHDRDSFRCGVEDLDAYLRRQAGQDVRRRAAVVFVMRHVGNPREIAGYYTLSSASVKLTAIPDALSRRMARYPDVPAILIGRLARDVRFPGIGGKLLVDAFQRSLRVAEEIAATVILVDAKNEAAARFYGSYGFETILGNVERMFVPLSVVAAALGGR